MQIWSDLRLNSKLVFRNGAARFLRGRIPIRQPLRRDLPRPLREGFHGFALRETPGRSAREVADDGCHVPPSKTAASLPVKSKPLS